MNKTKLQKGITLIALIITIVVLLILAVVAISAVQDSGIIVKAKDATKQHEIAQEKEKISLAYSEYFMSKRTNPNATLEVEGAEVKGNESNGWTITFTKTGNIYTVSNIGTIEYTGTGTVEDEEIKEPDLIVLEYTTTEAKIDEEICSLGINFNIKATISEEEYTTNKLEQITFDEKERSVVQYMSTDMDSLRESGEIFTKLDDATLYMLNNSGLATPRDELDKWLGESALIKEIFGDTTDRTSVKKEEINAVMYGFYIDFEGTELTNEEFINTFYEPDIDYSEEYNEKVSNLKMYILKDEEKLLYDNIQATVEGVNLDVYEIEKNGNYKFIIKDSTGEILVNKVIEINNIVENIYFGSRETWETNGNGVITKYLGNDSSVIVPKYVGIESIHTIGDSLFENNTSLIEVEIPETISEIQSEAFYGCSELTKIEFPHGITRINDFVFGECSSLKTVNLPETITNIDAGAFYACNDLETITIPNSVTEIFSGDDEIRPFGGCYNLTNIYFAPGDNTIPKGAPWGAPSTTNVEKLTKRQDVQ